MSRVAATTWLRYNAVMNLLVSVLTLTAWGLWGYVVLFVDPEMPLAPASFYAALFVALTGTLSRLLGGAPAPRDSESVALHISNIGHAASVSTLILFALWLQSLGMLTSLNGTLLAATLLLIELGFFISGSRRRPRGRRRPKRGATAEAGSAVEQ